MKLTLNRVAVCAADDCIEHTRQLQVDDHSTLRQVLDAVKAGDYIARVGNATWLVSLDSDGPLVALVAKQWRDAVLLVQESSTVVELGDRLFFYYLVQREPVAVLAALVDAMATERIEASTDGLLAVPLDEGPCRERPHVGRRQRQSSWFSSRSCGDDDAAALDQAHHRLVSNAFDTSGLKAGDCADSSVGNRGCRAQEAGGSPDPCAGGS